MLILNIPFTRQTNNFNCGPYALKMALSYLGNDQPIEQIQSAAGLQNEQMTFTIQIATASKLLGQKTEFFSKNVFMDEANIQMPYYLAHSANLPDVQKVVSQAQKAGVDIFQQTLSLDEILAKLSQDSVPVVLLDWNVALNKKEGQYVGHIVPIVGYDEKNVFVHNQGLKKTEPFMPIPKKTFEKARTAKGTDEDLVIVYR